MLEFMAVAVQLAGLLHDIGKGTVGFNAKLRKAVTGELPRGAGQDPLRHELISVLLMDVGDPAGFLRALSDEAEIHRAFEARRRWLASEECHAFVDEALCRTLDIATKESLSDFDFAYFLDRISLNRKQAWVEHPFWMSVMWLVMTHHKLPAGGWSNRERMFTALAKRHVGLRVEGGSALIAQRDQLSDFLKMPEEDQPWFHQEWRRGVANTLSSYFRLRKAYPDFESQMFRGAGPDEIGLGAATPWISILARQGRMSLVLGDYQASSDDVKEVCADPAGRLIANTKEIDGKTMLADLLHVHLSKTGHYAPLILTNLFGQKNPGFFSPVRIRNPEKPLALTLPSVIEASPYAWQSHAQRYMTAYQNTEKGFFAVVAAGTGKGKTRGCAALMTASRLAPRFSTLLSMRSLTFQTAKAYLSETIGFKPGQVAMMVGDEMLRRKLQAEKVNANKRFEGTAHIGTDNTFCESDPFALIYDGPQDAAIELSCLKADRMLMRLLSAPVSVMTVDHVMNAINLERSRQVLQMLHLMSTDLIIDEVDDYSEDDLICIGRLIGLAGHFGRRVIIASATLPKTVVEGFREAYVRGYKAHQSICEVEDADSLVITHIEPYVSIHGPEAFGDFYDGVMTKFAGAEATVAAEHPRRTVMDTSALMVNLDRKFNTGLNLVPADEGERPNRDDVNQRYFKALLAAIELAGHQNAMSDPGTGVDYSAGFVRLNSVRSAQAFVRWYESTGQQALQAAKGIEHKFVCYHAQTLGLMRVLQEQFFETCLNRTSMNDGGADPLLGSSDVLEALAGAKARGIKRVIFVVVTSSLMEVGRDYDFDWCVLEPCSTTSSIQSGGRVRRHRKNVYGKPNVFLMPLSIQCMINPRKAWRGMSEHGYEPADRPLPEHVTAMRLVGVKNTEPATGKPLTTKQAFSPLLVGPGKALHAGHCLTVPHDYALAPVTVMERVKQLGWLSIEHARRDREQKLSHLTLEYAYSACDPLLVNSFYAASRFRGDNHSEKLEYLRDSFSWCRLNKNDRVVDASHLVRTEFIPPSATPSVYLMKSLDIGGMGDLLSLSQQVGRVLGYAESELPAADSTLLGTQIDVRNDVTAIEVHPQLGVTIY